PTLSDSYPLSLHDALPIYLPLGRRAARHQVVSLRKRLPSRRILLLAAAGAVMMLFAYPPASLVLPSFVVLVPLLFAMDELRERGDRKSTRLNSSHVAISYA